MKHLLFSSFILLALLGRAQEKSTETVSIMYYNLLQFPNNTLDRVDTLEKIIRHVEPDLFLVCELESSYGATQILNNSMNTQGVTHYNKAVFYDGNATDNMLFYNSDKFGIADQNQIGGGTRDISEYKIYYKEPGIDANTDTIYMYLYCAHLKAGSTQGDENTRESEATIFKNYLTSKGRSGNLIIGGDFNVYTDSEAAVQMILNGGTVPFNDPINQLGDWNNNSSYAAVHTQSTRASGGYAGGSSGGMDDRFDMILISDEVKNGSNNVAYVPGSYEAIGQDGNRFNGSVNDGFNFSVPADIADALYYMSDHLPVYLEMNIEYPVGIQEVQQVVSGYSFLNENELKLSLKEEVQLESVQIFNLSGQLVATIVGKNDLINVGTLSTGVYVLRAYTNKGVASVKFVKG